MPALDLSLVIMLPPPRGTLSIGVDLAGKTDADWNAGLVLDLLAADPHVVPSIGLHADVAPEIGASQICPDLFYDRHTGN